MRSITSFATPFSARILLALMIAAGGIPSVACVGRDAARLTLDSYRSVVRVYDRARQWERIARWWIDPEMASDPHSPEPTGSALCELRAQGSAQ